MLQKKNNLSKNILFLYFRMIITMLVSLFTSRVVLKVLGETDFGIYNIVGGIVILFSFLNSSMSTATQRFFNIDIGINNNERLKRTFSVCLTVHIIIAIIIVILSETIGTWFLNYKMNIPRDRLLIANWVFQFSIFSFVMNIIRVPYNALIISYERMNFYAYISIVEVCLKLLIVYILYFNFLDNLLCYGLLTFLVISVVTIIYKQYCNINFPLSKFKLCWDKKRFKEIISFSGWSTFGSLANISSVQGNNLLLNLFWGVSVNAAAGIANQVSGAIQQFVSNFQFAFNPRIVQSYASNNKEYFQSLVFQSSKISTFLMIIICTPVVLNIDYILYLWLGDVPKYTSQFVITIIIYMTIDAMSSPLWLSAQAKGNIKKYQITISTISLLTLPLSYISLLNGCSPISIWIVRICINIILFIYRCIYSNYAVGLNMKIYTRQVLSKIFIVTSCSILSMYYIDSFYNYGLKKLLFTSIISIVINCIIILFLGLSNDERNKLLIFFKAKSICK